MKQWISDVVSNACLWTRWIVMIILAPKLKVPIHSMQLVMLALCWNESRAQKFNSVNRFVYINDVKHRPHNNKHRLVFAYSHPIAAKPMISHNDRSVSFICCVSILHHLMTNTEVLRCSAIFFWVAHILEVLMIWSIQILNRWKNIRFFSFRCADFNWNSCSLNQICNGFYLTWIKPRRFRC